MEYPVATENRVVDTCIFTQDLYCPVEKEKQKREVK